MEQKQCLKQMCQGGKIPKINTTEREILEFCHNRDMIAFLKEEFEKHPILQDEDGNYYYKRD